MLCAATGGRRLPGFGLAGFRGSGFGPVSGGAVLARFRSPGSGLFRAAPVAPGVLPPSVRARGGTLSVGPDGLGCDVASVVRAAWGSGGFGCALRAHRSGAGPRGVPHSVRAVPSSPFWPRKSLAGRLVSFGSGPGRNLFRWFWWLRMCRRFRLFGRFRLLRGPVVREAPVACRGFVRRLPALLSSGPHLGGTGGFSLLRAARLALRGLRLDKSSEKARTGLNYS